MSYTAVEPCEELKDFVNHFWFAKWAEQTQHAPSTYFSSANTLVEIAFAFEGSKKHPKLLFSSIQGQTSGYGQYSASGFFELFGVSLYSHAIPYLFQIPASALNNEFITMEALLGNEGKILTEKIATAISANERINILTDFFKSKMVNSQSDDKLIIKAVKKIRQYHGNINIERLSHNFFYSHKQFNRIFKEYSGFNPKLFARIVRFESVLKNHAYYDNLTQAAYSYGYYDQAHFIRDFRGFSGFSPKKFFEISGY